MKHLGVAAILCMGLSACDVNHADSKDHSAVATTSRHEDSLIKSTTKVKTLDDAAGRTFLPEGIPDQSSKLSEADQQYAGRYHTRISCEDNFADCETGEAEYILNFSVHDKFHRTLILSGFCLLKIAKISLNSSFFPKPIKR
ncbi:hypothetical protein JUNP402_0423 [Acinetobacter baumannii]|nr:hypothetical protein DJICPGNB_02015 [Acinetobacter baumannii]